MKLSVHKEQFQEAVLKAERVSGKNLSLPVLRCVLLVAEGNTLIVRSTNLDIGIEVRVPAEIKEPGTVAIPADILSSFLSSSGSGGSLLFEQAGNHITITGPHSTTNITLYPHDDFPLLPKITDTELFVVVGDEFSKALKSVWWASSPASIKPELSSVYVYGNGDEVVCVATDSFRLAEKRVRAKTGKGFESVLIPLKNTGEFIRHLEGVSGDVSIKGDVHQISCIVGDVYITSRVIDGTFPDYKQIIPKEKATEAVVLKQDLADTLKQLRIFSDQFNKLTVSIHPKEKEFVLKTTNPDVGDSTATIDAALSGDVLEMHFNHAYVIDALQSTHTDSVTLQFAGVGKPLAIRSVGDQSFLYIVMPMNR